MRYLSALLATAILALPQVSWASVYHADITKSSLDWVGKKVTENHTGKLKLKSGSIKMENGQIQSANLLVDMSSITVTDIKNKTYNKKLRDHLKSDDFFSVKNNPTAEFALNEIKPDKGGKLRAFGDLTIKGIKKPIDFPVEVNTDGDKVRIVGTAVINRTLYDIRYKSGKFFPNLGDKLIYDNFDVSFNIIATPKSADKPKAKKKTS